jgi:membrane-associated phospholipid phosphatase
METPAHKRTTPKKTQEVGEAPGIWDGFFRDVSALGGMVSYVSVVAFAFFMDQRLFLPLIVGLAIIVVVTVVTRLLFFRDRPRRQAYTGVISRIDASSFPSLHSARATYLAVMLSVVSESIGVALLSSLLALLVCCSRYKLRKHFVSDIVAGVVLGLVTAAVVLWFFIAPHPI